MKTEIDENYVVLSIEDSGEGIDSKDLPYIFEPFYQGTQDENTKKKGSGLGLAICDYIIKKHNGEIYLLHMLELPLNGKKIIDDEISVSTFESGHIMGSVALFLEIKRNDGKDYDKVDETLTAAIGYPALFTRWNGSISYEKKEGEAKTSTKYELSGNESIKLISRSECNADSTCKKLFDGSVAFQQCSTVVDKTHYRATSPDSQMTSFNCSAKE